MAKKKNVTIYGCGMSGLVAAINLAREGYEVTVHDREKSYGGDPMYNPSAHTTPILPKKVSDYIGIDITPCFQPLQHLPSYFHETKVEGCPPISGEYTVERGPRPTSLDSYLYPKACDLGVKFEFNSPLKKDEIAGLEPGTIIACGLTPDVYDMLEIPYYRWYGWISRGEIGFSARSWLWWDECITEYGYLSSINNYYFNLLFSIKPVSKEALEKYKDFMKRREGVEHAEWHYGGGAVPTVAPENPQLFRKGLIYCGTMSGFMEPFGWFGINGALISGKLAAMAVSDPAKAQAEFADLSRYFYNAWWFKNKIWYPYLRGHIGMFEKIINLIGPDRFSRLLAKYINEQRHVPFAIPGYANLGARY